MVRATKKKKILFFLDSLPMDSYITRLKYDGVILDIVSAKKPLDYVQYLFEVKDRTKASNTFSPNGLYLANIKYEKKFKIVDLKYSHNMNNIKVKICGITNCMMQ